MSRWLKNVNSLLEQLDGTVESTIEERAERAEEESAQPGQGKEAVESILAKRGLSDSKLEESTMQLESTKVEEPNDASVEEDSKDMAVASLQPLNIDTDVTEVNEQVEEAAPASPQTDEPKEAIMEAAPDSTLVHVKEDGSSVLAASDPADMAAGAKETSTTAVRDEVEGDAQISSQEPAARVAKPPSEHMPPAKVSRSRQAPSPARTESGQSFEAEYKAALADARESQKEARTLRRHVVSLNTELETAEAELQAQRVELERAGERLEKDRSRFKEEKDRLASRHAEEIKTLNKQHEQTVAEYKSRNDKLSEEARVQLREVEERRMQEGGDWNKELEGAIEREREIRKRFMMLEDEKSTLLSQVSTLQTQLEASESRSESISQTADGAMRREREAEDKLDAALAMHAHQLSQRKSRESELERTIADLGAALVVATNKEVARLKALQEGGEAESGGGKELREKLHKYEDELETVTAQLETERQRAQTLNQDLRELSKERAEEVAAAHAKEVQNDRKIADMSLTISRLQSNISKRESMDDSIDMESRLGDDENAKQIKELSGQLVRQQERSAHLTSEISTLKSRLQVALNRAEMAEGALAAAESMGSSYDAGSAPSSGNYGEGMRKRGGRRQKKPESVRSALLLTTSQNSNVEKVGQAIDVLDTFSVKSGSYLRRNPLARGGFILYLLLLHLWTFVVIVFHAHNYEPVHGDFGQRGIPHGPHALMQQFDPHQLSQQQQQVMEKIKPQVVNAKPVAAVEEKAPKLHEQPKQGGLRAEAKKPEQN